MMLILTRKLGEAIKLGDEITVSIVEIKGNHVRLGIDAPADVMVYRKELYEKIRSENIMASSISVADFSKISEALKKDD